MINQQLSDYIKELLAQGTAKEKISESLLAAGWDKKDVEEALKNFVEEKPPITPEVPPLLTTTKTSKAPVKMKAIIIMVLLGILVLGGGAFAYYRFLWMTPEKVMAKMMENLETVKTFEYSGQADISFTPEQKTDEPSVASTLASDFYQDSSPIKLTITFNGAADANDANNQKGRLAIKIDSKQAENKMSLSLETISLEKVVYLKFTELPDLGFISLSPLEEQWIKTDLKDIEDNTNLISTDMASSSLLEEKKKKLEKLLTNKDLFQISAELEDEIIDGNNSYHYQLNISDENQYNLIIAILGIINDEKVSEEEETKIKESLKKKDFPGLDLWVSKKDYLPTKISFKGRTKDDEGNITGEINLSLFLKNYNQTMKIEAPESSKSFQEVFTQVVNDFMGEGNNSISWSDNEILTGEPGDEMFTEEPGQEDSIEYMFSDTDSDGDGLSDQEEMFLGTDLNKADTDDDGYPDGAEIEAGYNPLGEGKFMMPTE